MNYTCENCKCIDCTENYHNGSTCMQCIDCNECDRHVEECSAFDNASN